ncbi:hypothetical protein [Vibrio sp. THAF190c]|uniref:hypothetical protein n=1 Tax=Vibrio sp. THAF190c TaxID=2587865 RepID=UPI001268A631|nr:hypothetical protein [Vibrio sp. THAF190c]QFT13455.1 hypothetical protein FIV04_26230 [Vibrio sp. THAF190c]
MSSSLSATLERINVLRKKAMSDPEFIEGVKEHTEAIEREQEAQSLNDTHTRKKRKKPKEPPLSSLYAHLNERPVLY